MDLQLEETSFIYRFLSTFLSYCAPHKHHLSIIIPSYEQTILWPKQNKFMV